MANYTMDYLTISGPSEDIDAIISTYSTEQTWEDGSRHTLLIDGEKVFPYPQEIKDSTEDELGSPRANWRRDKWGCAAPSDAVGFARIAPTCVRGDILTRWAGPEELYFEISKRYPRCIVEIHWYCDSGNLGDGTVIAGLCVRSGGGHEDDGRYPQEDAAQEIISARVNANSTDAEMWSVALDVERVCPNYRVEDIKRHRDFMQTNYPNGFPPPQEKVQTPKDLVKTITMDMSDADLAVLLANVHRISVGEWADWVNVVSLDILIAARDGLRWLDANPVPKKAPELLTAQPVVESAAPTGFNF